MEQPLSRNRIEQIDGVMPSWFATYWQTLTQAVKLGFVFTLRWKIPANLTKNPNTRGSFWLIFWHLWMAAVMLARAAASAGITVVGLLSILISPLTAIVMACIARKEARKTLQDAFAKVDEMNVG